jgi:glycosyltransferase involved in cell wall biosynthesis
VNNYHSSLVSVIIPTYNAEKFIERTLNSVISQTYLNIEVLVVDDGSQDRTAEVVKAIAQKDSRIILLQQENAGVAAARNLAIEKSRGEYIAPIDADDIWYPQNLEKQVQCMLQADSSVGVVYSWSVDIDEEDRLTGGFYNSNLQGKIRAALVYKYFIGNASSSLIRRACFEKVGGYNRHLKEQNAQGCEDWEIYLRIAKHYQFRVVPEFLVGYRQITSSMSCNDELMAKSHSLVMASVRQQSPEILPKTYRWSSSSFYVYLAAKNSRSGNVSRTLFWLYEALKLDTVMMLLRHHLYALTIISIFQLIVQAVTSTIASDSCPPLPLRAPEREMTTVNIIRRTNIHRFLPAQLYERWRLSKLVRPSEKTEFLYSQIPKVKAFSNIKSL